MVAQPSNLQAVAFLESNINPHHLRIAPVDGGLPSERIRTAELVAFAPTETHQVIQRVQADLEELRITVRGNDPNWAAGEAEG